MTASGLAPTAAPVYTAARERCLNLTVPMGFPSCFQRSRQRLGTQLFGSRPPWLSSHSGRRVAGKGPVYRAPLFPVPGTPRGAFPLRTLHERPLLSGGLWVRVALLWPALPLLEHHAHGGPCCSVCLLASATGCEHRESGIGFVSLPLAV